eukprot:CAMPEP_0196573506 /NCGR_PEP_ID=MMETSP1081-20130531/3400_1 /TAXON_ID=36882 /ORGANISM="Pyramimonas amylifera, Strain CCMP720" /LENGTH=1001 /DNA_ID=CAMNT_0041891243 /DNA_START=137 /DNA_END=3142 /DNA_ORIENTATION=-
MACCVYCLFSIPFFAAFMGTSPGPLTQVVVELSIDLFFMIDIVLEFNTARFSTIEEGYIVGAVEVSQFYLHGWFTVDLLSSFPLEIFLLPSGEGRHLIRLVKLLRVFRLRNFGRGGQVIHARIVGHILRLVKVLVRFLYITHIISCSLYAISKHHYNFDHRTWAAQVGLVDDNLSTRFLKSLFFALTVTTGIGNTPAPPTLEGEVALMCISMVVGTAYLSYAIANMFDLISSIKRNESVYDYNMDQLKYWLEHKKIPKHTQEMAMRHFNYQWERHRFVNDDTVLAHLSPSLQLVLRRFLCRDVVISVSVFKASSDAFVDQLVNSLRAKFVTSGEIVCRQDEMGLEMYVISKGEIAVMLNQEGAPPKPGLTPLSSTSSLVPQRKNSQNNVSYITVLSKGTIFGEISIIFDVPRICTCRTITQCDLFTLSKEEFFHVILPWPEEFDNIRDIANQRAIMSIHKDLFDMQDIDDDANAPYYLPDDIDVAPYADSYSGVARPSTGARRSIEGRANNSFAYGRSGSINAPANLKAAQTAYNYRRRISMDPRKLQSTVDKMSSPLVASSKADSFVNEKALFRQSSQFSDGPLLTVADPDTTLTKSSSVNEMTADDEDRKLASELLEEARSNLSIVVEESWSIQDSTPVQLPMDLTVSTKNEQFVGKEPVFSPPIDVVKYRVSRNMSDTTGQRLASGPFKVSVDREQLRQASLDKIQPPVSGGPFFRKRRSSDLSEVLKVPEFNFVYDQDSPERGVPAGSVNSPIMREWLPVDPSSSEANETSYLSDEFIAKNSSAPSLESIQTKSSPLNEASKPGNSSALGEASTPKNKLSTLSGQTTPNNISTPTEGDVVPKRRFNRVVSTRDGELNLEYLEQIRSNSIEDKFALVRETHEKALRSLESSSEGMKAGTPGLISVDGSRSSRGFKAGTPNAFLIENEQGGLQPNVDKLPEFQLATQTDEALPLSNEILKKLNEIQFSSKEQSEQVQDLLLMFAAEIMESLASSKSESS